jgi:FkbM family methyltransferase
MAEKPPANAELDTFIQLVQKAPHLAPEFERIAAYVQGKGYGTATIVEEVKLALQQLKKPPLLAVDIGGNVGDYTAELRGRNPHLEIHTFEPSSINVAKLKKRFIGDLHVKIVPLAVSSATGAATLFSNKPGSGLASLTRRRLEHYDIKFNFKEAVHTIRFEEYWAGELGKRHVDIVKIDVEGHELAALHGFGAAMKETSIVQFEFGGTNIDARTFFQDFWYFFRENDFDVFRITPSGLAKIELYRETCECFSISNYIAVNRHGN